MSLATLLGVLFGFGLFISSVLLSTDNYKAFLNLPSFVMVVGGDLCLDIRCLRTALCSERSENRAFDLLRAPDGPACSDKRGWARDLLGVHRPEKRPARTGSRCRQAPPAGSLPGLCRRSGHQRLHRGGGAGDPCQYRGDNLSACNRLRRYSAQHGQYRPRFRHDRHAGRVDHHAGNHGDPIRRKSVPAWRWRW